VPVKKYVGGLKIENNMSVSVRGNPVLVITLLLLGCASGGSGGFGAAPSLTRSLKCFN